MWDVELFRLEITMETGSMTSKSSKNRFGGLFNGYIPNNSVFINSSSIVTILGTNLGQTMFVTRDL